MPFITLIIRVCMCVLILTSCGAALQVPTPVEQAVREYVATRCEGVDTPCGDWRITQIKDLAVSATAQRGGANSAWCVDYALQRLNTGRYTRMFWRWANIPEAVIVVERTGGQYESTASNKCDITVLE